jgi:N-acetylmuramoyl-L-alanine amidase
VSSPLSRARSLITLFVVALLVNGVHTYATRRGHERRHVVDALIIHSLGGPDCRDGRRFFKQIEGDAVQWARTFESLPGVSIHYVIDRDGTVVSAIPEDLAASHAIGWNQRSIGIELVNNGDGHDLFPEPQMTSLIRLAREIRQRHPAIAPERILRHSDVDRSMFSDETLGVGCSAFRRKLDPGAAFPWDAFKAAIAR